ncbi:hypothetical protein AB0F20_38420 [Streptomyces goshikiensis]|uniref:hypothetical protein n=1 Tax=Streptomyces goshikiensis TaxID=1942 RepID=UPI0033DCACBB
MSVERHVAGMLQQIARQQDVVEIAPQGSTPKAAALAHVAEQYGYSYGMAYRTGLDLITFDVMALYIADRSQKVKGYLACAVLTVILLIDRSPVEAVASGGAVALLFTVAFKVGASRRGKIAQRLTDAGFLAVRDEQGGQRFLRPGQQLPGHTNPFAA